MKNTFIFIALTILLTACSHRDAQLSHQVAGVWDDGRTKFTFNPDGSFVNQMVDGGRTNEYAGTWRIRDGFLTMTFTNASGSHPDAEISHKGLTAG